MALAMAGMFASGHALALGLGDIELKSALNQPLLAEVELVSATPDEVDELKVELGSPAAFSEAGIDRPLFLTKLRFDVTRRADGKAVLMITSRKPVREPFLDFLLEVSWSKGRLLREYTVLVDPPVTMPAQAPAPHLPAAAAVATPAPVVSPPPAAPRTARAARAPVTAAPGQYGPTRRNDTLWKIAEQVRPDRGVSMEQTMLGLLRANPDAFYANNINNLKAGYILRIPDRAEMTAISRSEALRQTRAQYAAWRAARAPAAAQKAAAAPAAPATKLQLVAPELEQASSGRQGKAGEQAASLESLKRELVLANEAMAAQRRQSEEMAGRLALLEEQIQNMQRLIQLKDDELARLQALAGKPEPEPAAAPGVAPAEQMPPAEQAAPAPVEIPPGAETAVPPVVGVETPPAAGAESAPAAEALVPSAPDATPPVAAPGFVERLLAHPLWLGAGVVVLGLLALIGLRRRRGVETEFQESILQSAQGDAEAEAESVATATEPRSHEPAASESSLLSEFAVSDMGAIRNEGEADPLSEADVYLAYGRYQQAEDLIKEALEKEPEREDINLKLLEVYQAARNEGAFEAHAQALLAGMAHGDDALWAKIAEMGRELSPDNPLYQSPAAPAPTGGDSETPEADLEFDQGEPTPPPGAEAEAAEPDFAEGLEFDLNLSEETGELAGEAETGPFESEPAAEAPEFELPEADIEPAAGEAQAAQPEEEALEFDMEGFDFGEAEDAQAEPSQDGELADLDEVSTKLDLARAYIDMGDPDGARSILDEVLEEGNEDQKNEAQGILEQIA